MPPSQSPLTVKALAASRVLVVDDDPGIRRFLSQLLERSGYSPRSLDNLEDFFDAMREGQYGCILLDMCFANDRDGAQVFQEMIRQGWKVPVIIISGFATVPLAVEMMRAGVQDVLVKSDVTARPAILLEAMEKALAIGARWHQEEASRQKALALLDKLTPREVETIRWALTGMLNKQIAAEMGITERTVIAHRMSVMRKLRLSSFVQLSEFARDCGLSQATPYSACS